MKDKDFDEIGKRLYDMEADPPQDGWDKLYGGLRPVPPRGKLVFFRKHWWKPFVLLIPLATYYFVSDSGNAEKIAVVSSTKTAEAARAQQGGDKTQDANSNPEISGEGPVKSEVLDHNNMGVQPTAIAPQENSSSDPTVAPGKNIGVSSNAHEDNSTNDSSLDQDNFAVGSAGKDGNKIPITETPGGPAVSATIFDETVSTKEKEVGENHKDNSIGKEAGTLIIATEAMTQTPQAKSELISSGGSTNNVSESVLLAEVADADPNSNAQGKTSPITETSSMNKNTAFAGPPLATGFSTTAANAQDSVATIASIEAVQSDSATMQSNDDAGERKESLSPWRVSLGITPQYVTKTVKPLPNDEVMMFLNSGNSKHTGLVATLGIGRAITNNFYLDLQFSMQKSQQDLSYSYSTGSVDTLIALRQADGTIIVSPVYELSTTEITTNYTYGGMRLTGTYYFWYNARGRFNLTAGASLNSLLDAKIHENSNGEWIDVSDDYKNKTNYSLSISGGYSFIFRKGWELMVNPVLTYYPSNEQIRDLPFGVQRKSYGLNFSLLKNLRSRK
jgi:hypothetical protein